MIETINKKAYSVILLSEKPDNKIFRNLYRRLKSEYNAVPIVELEDFDCNYYDFKIGN
ncbi:MAG: hypothetical protein ACE364_06910 [Chlorobiota bacterium]